MRVEPAGHTCHHRWENGCDARADEEAEDHLKPDQRCRLAGESQTDGEDDRPGRDDEARAQAMLVNARARKPIVIALDTPVTDHPVSRVMAPRNTGSENIAPIATQPSRPPAATIT